MKLKNKAHFNKIYQLLAIVLLCVSLIILTYNSTVAWFRDESITSNSAPNIKIIGTLGLDVTTNFNFYNLALAPDTTYLKDVNDSDIGTYIKVATEHNIDGAYVRVRYTCNRPELTLHFDSDMLTTITSPEDGSWVYNAGDNFYYYLGFIGKSNTQFNAGYTVDNTLDNTDAYADVEIELYFETIQRQYGASSAVWTTSPDCFKAFVLTDENKVHNANGK